MNLLRCCSLLLLGCILSACIQPRRISLDYLIAPCVHEDGRLDVTLTIHGLRGDNVALRGYAPAQHMRISSLSVATLDQHHVACKEEFVDVARRKQAFEVPRYLLPNPAPSDIIVSYCVWPGKEEVDTHRGTPSTSYGYLGKDYAVLRGRHLFILPDAQMQIGRTVVRFAPGLGGPVHAPWVRSGNVYRPDLSMPGRAAEALVTATVGIGDFTSRSLTLGRTAYEFLLAPGIPVEEFSSIIDPMSRILRYTHKLVPDAFGDQYLIFVAPPREGGVELAGEAWLLGQSGQFYPPTVSRLRDFARGVMKSIVKDGATPLGTAPKSLFWVQDGAIELYAWKALISEGSLGDADLINHVAQSYLQHLGQASATTSLEAAYDTTQPSAFVRDILAPLAYLDISEKARRSGPLPKDDAYLLHSLLYSREPLTPAVLISRVPDEVRSNVREHVIESRDPHILDQFNLASAPANSPARVCGEVQSAIRVIYTGNTEGYLESCGCKVNESGGIARRATVLTRLRHTSTPTLLVDAGNYDPAADSTASPEDEVEARERQFYRRFMAQETYDLVFPSTNEYAREGTAVFAPQRERGFLQVPPVPGLHQETGAYQVTEIKSGKMTIGAIALLDRGNGTSRPDSYLEMVDRFPLPDPVVALGEALGRLPKDLDLVIVGGNLLPSTVRRVAATYPRVDIVVSTDREREAVVDPHGEGTYFAEDQEGFLGTTLVLYPSLGKYGVNSATLLLDAAGHVCRASFDWTLLDASVEDDRVIRSELAGFYSGLERELEPSSPRHSPGESVESGRNSHGSTFVGANRCEACHHDEYMQWAATEHASAYKTLLDRHRHFHPACVGCHVVGYGRKGGFEIAHPSATLANVQCESCHGPGGEHAASPTRLNINGHVDARVCVECHDTDHSDRFEYAQKIARIVHAGQRQSDQQTVERSHR